MLTDRVCTSLRVLATWCCSGWVMLGNFSKLLKRWYPVIMPMASKQQCPACCIVRMRFDCWVAGSQAMGIGCVPRAYLGKSNSVSRFCCVLGVLESSPAGPLACITGLGPLVLVTC